MKDQLYLLLDTIGIERKHVSIIEGWNDNDDLTIMYPNFMELLEIDKHLSDKKLSEKLEEIITEHLLEVQHDLSLIKRFRKNYE